MRDAAARRFVHALVAPREGDVDRILMRALDKGVVWPNVVRIAGENDLSALLYWRLSRTTAWPRVPTDIARTLEREYHMSGLRNAVLFRFLASVLRALRRAFIPVIVLKGAALAEHTWGSAAVRPMSDYDLLVRRDALARTEQALAALGFAPDEHRYPRSWFAAHHHLVPLVHPAFGARVELHHALTPELPGFSVDTAGLWARALSADVAGERVLVLSPADTVTSLALHVACQPFDGRSHSLADMAVLIRTQGDSIDWNLLANEAARGRYSRRLYHPLRIVSEAFHVRVPDTVLSRLREDARVGFVDDRVMMGLSRRNLWRGSSSDGLLPAWVLGTLYRHIIDYPGRGGWRRAIGAVLEECAEDQGRRRAFPAAALTDITLKAARRLRRSRRTRGVEVICAPQVGAASHGDRP